jgi:flagellar basal-body rod modification protein FlgD
MMAANAASATTQALNSPNTPGGAGGLLNNQKDAAEASTAPKFGEVLQNMQAKYGARAEKPREIKKTLGKDDFLRIMITQMRHQDPTNPFKAEQMATEMAQFTSVEQMQNINQNLQKMANQNQPLERLAMTNMIGKVVTVDRDRFAHVEGQNDSLAFNLSRPASQVRVALISEAGEVVLEKEIGPQKQGESTFNWDGVRGNSLPAKSGNYIMRVEARDENDVAIQTESKRKGRVVGVSFEAGEPILLVGDNRRQDKVTMKSITRIESDGPAVGGASAGAAPLSAAEDAKSAPNFIAFQKGVGSSNLDASSAPPEVMNALSKFQNNQAALGAPAAAKVAAPNQAAVSAAAPAVKAEGFPNGLSNGMNDDERR